MPSALKSLFKKVVGSAAPSSWSYNDMIKVLREKGVSEDVIESVMTGGTVRPGFKPKGTVPRMPGYVPEGFDPGATARPGFKPRGTMDVPEPGTLNRLTGGAAAKGGKLGWLKGMGGIGAVLALLGLPTIISEWGELLGLKESDLDKQIKLAEKERGASLLGNAMILASDSDRRREERMDRFQEQGLGAIMAGGQQDLMQQAMAAEAAMSPRGRAAASALQYTLAGMGDPRALMISEETPFSDAGFIQ